MKKFLKSKAVQTFIAWLLHKYSLLVFYTSRKNFQDKEIAEKIFSSGRPYIFCFWHGRIFFPPLFVPEPKKTYAMISRHGDGAFIARIMDFFGINYIRGSSNRLKTSDKGAKDRGGSIAFRESVRLLNEGKILVITPDGPRGPRMRAQNGAIQLASISGAPIIPISCSSSRCKIMNSWDRFLLPFPFSRITLMVGKVINVPAQLDNQEAEKYRIDLENELNELTRKCDESVGIEPVSPAEIRNIQPDKLK